MGKILELKSQLNKEEWIDYVNLIYDAGKITLDNKTKLLDQIEKTNWEKP